ADISRESGLSAPTVSRIVENLIGEGLVREIGEGESHGGRRPTLLKFSAADNGIIGIDLGTTNIYGVLTDFNANIIAEIRRPTRVEEGFQKVMERTSEVIDTLRDSPENRTRKIHGIGMAVAGLINRRRNIVEFSPDFHWHNVDVVGALAGKHDIPVIFDNVTRVMALGEKWYGIGKECRNFICVNVGYGIGAGIVVDGQLLYGPSGMAGEFGHITLAKDSAIQCACGNFGCLEALASGSAIAKAARMKLQSGVKSLLLDLCGNDIENVTAEMVAAAAKQGDAVAWDVFNGAAEYLGIGIACLINLLNPEAVAIGGGVAQAGDILFDMVRKTVNGRALKNISRDVAIMPATHGMKAAVMGAVSLILSDVLSLNNADVQET
ncbi:MAG: ROK family transcriptional regulator, partial [Armatimonadetes bacterium]|nr:ROK family transcriptional regulator [Armatimonadota bacterium]